MLRYFTVYGPAGRPDMSIFRFVRQIAARRAAGGLMAMGRKSVISPMSRISPRHDRRRAAAGL